MGSTWCALSCSIHCPRDSCPYPPSWVWKQVCLSGVTGSLLDGYAIEDKLKGQLASSHTPSLRECSVKMCYCYALLCGRSLSCAQCPVRVCRSALEPYLSGHTPCSFPACLYSVTLRRSLSFLLPQAAWTWLNHLAPSLLLQGEITHDEFCAACKRGASLQPCGTCSGAYHLSCLDPPLKTPPKGLWVCPKCQRKVWAEGLTPLPCTFETVFWVMPAWVEQGAVRE